MNLEQAGRVLWLQVKRCNIWLAIGAVIAMGVIWFMAESQRIAFEGERERARQRRATAKALNMTTEELERQMREMAFTPP